MNGGLLPETALSLAELEAHDPQARAGGRERRFLCPLPACADHQRPSEHRCLAVNTETGAWCCHRCEAHGLLREWWTEKPAPVSKRDLARKRFRRRLALPEPPDPDPGPDPDDADWRRLWRKVRPLLGTPGAAYLTRRGIPARLADAAGVGFSGAWYGRAAVVFPIHDADGAQVAAQGRAISGKLKLTAGPISRGIFATPGALCGPAVLITEAPIDALSLHVAGFPAVALCGKELGEARGRWLVPLLAWKAVLLAFDSDEAGEKAAEKIAPLLAPVGAKARRLRPGRKDWNEALQLDGPEALAEAVRPLVPEAPPPPPPVESVGDGGAWPPWPMDSFEAVRSMLCEARRGNLPRFPRYTSVLAASLQADPNAAALCALELARAARAAGERERQADHEGDLWELSDWWYWFEQQIGAPWAEAAAPITWYNPDAGASIPLLATFTPEGIDALALGIEL